MCESYPTIRIGRLAKAVNGAGKAQAANYNQGEAIMKLMELRSSDIAGAIWAAVADAASDNGWTAILLSDLGNLPPGHRSPDLGAVFDLPNVEFKLDDQLMVLRCCVTACVNELSEVKPKDVYSKLWSRIFCKEDRGAAATDMEEDRIGIFFDHARVLSRAALEVLRKPYEDIFREVLGPKHKIELLQEIEASAIGTDQSDFQALFAKLKAGERLSKQTDNRAAQKLVRLAALSGDIIETPVLSTVAGREDVSCSLYDGMDMYKGVFLAKISGDSAQFLGLTHLPFDYSKQAAAEIVNSGDRKVQAGYHVSAAVSRTLGRYF